MKRAGVRALVLTAAALSTSCSVATNLGYDEIAVELDNIVIRDGAGADQRLRYADRAEVSKWYMHNVLTTPLRPVLGFLFGQRAMSDLPNPSGHVRELISVLPWRAVDLAETSDAIVRLLAILELDPNALNRIVALDGICMLCDRLGIPLLQAAPGDLLAELEQERIGNARVAVQAGRAASRNPAAFDAAAAAAFLGGVDLLVQHALPDWWDRAAWISDLRQLHREETDLALRTGLEAALRRAIGHGVDRAIVRALQGRGSGHASVRLCAMQQFRRHGGPGRVPLLLALMAAPSGGGARLTDRFDPDPAVKLYLVQLCGQLRGEMAETAVQLPGRESWDAIAPVDYLALTVLGEQTYYSRLRVPAMAALSLSLGRKTLDYDVQWVEEWARSRRLKS